MYLITSITYKLGAGKQGGQAAHKEARPLTGKPGLLQEGWPSYREAGPLTGRPS